MSMRRHVRSVSALAHEGAPSAPINTGAEEPGPPTRHETEGPPVDAEAAGKIQAVLKVLDYTKTNKKWFDEKALPAGYHTVSIMGERFVGQRDPERRLLKLPLDFTGKKVVDIGCSNGGLLHALADVIAFGVGVDFNARCINAANAVRAANQVTNVHFYTFDLDDEDLSLLPQFFYGEQVDVCLFLNISLWVRRWKEVFSLMAAFCRTMVFEAHGSEAQQALQLDHVRSTYEAVELVSERSDDDPTYAKRKMYVCSRQRVSDRVAAEPAGAGAPERFDEAHVRDLIQRSFPEEGIRSLHFFPHTQESICVEINGRHIVKIPRPRRGVAALIAEQCATAVMRPRLPVAVPDMVVQREPVALGRYPKLEGVTFDRQRYEVLDESGKAALAAQIAAVLVAFHGVPRSELDAAGFVGCPSWEIKTGLIEAQLFDDPHPSIQALVRDVVANHLALPHGDDEVFGHFDLHGSNILLDGGHQRLTGLLDFGNCKIGDLHQDLSALNLSSPDLGARVMAHYAHLSGRGVSKQKVQHYTTIFYLNLLAGLRKQGSSKYTYWLEAYEGWYQYLLRDRAADRLDACPPLTGMPAAWRTWLAKGLIRGSSDASLTKVLRDKGFAPLDIAVELLAAQCSAHVQAGRELMQTLRKREWLLATMDDLARLDHRYAGEVEVIDVPPFADFIKGYYSKQLPVVIKGGACHWPALSQWTPQSLAQRLGDRQIEVQFDRDADPLFERHAGKLKKKMSLGEFVDLIQATEASNNFYMTANNTKGSLCGIAPLFDDIGDFGPGYRRAFDDGAASFLWLGPKGTFTPLHHDLTNNMLVQILGRKKVTLIPAMQVPWLYNDTGVFSAASYPGFDAQRHPQMAKATPVEVTIGPGDALFIPIGWWHCVESLDVSISVSFTNFDAPNPYAASYPRD